MHVVGEGGCGLVVDEGWFVQEGEALRPELIVLS